MLESKRNETATSAVVTRVEKEHKLRGKQAPVVVTGTDADPDVDYPMLASTKQVLNELIEEVETELDMEIDRCHEGDTKGRADILENTLGRTQTSEAITFHRNVIVEATNEKTEAEGILADTEVLLASTTTYCNKETFKLEQLVRVTKEDLKT